VILYSLVKLIDGIVFASRARKGGWIVYGDGRETIWVRKSQSWGRWWRLLTGRPREDEVLEVDGGTEERSWWAWGNVSKRRDVRYGEPARRPLLG
jgi:hypothetical protein